ncbi:gustatory receptor for sugar taste 64f isoform X1 [Rhynchophorus ferrugineus]|uniref:gustatory receptor for sugar taste 64f isoform X1 n=1 Tax=Rhynchophorus ferrugineus TaxID=354439 RepID=UPI003FCE6FA6
MSKVRVRKSILNYLRLISQFQIDNIHVWRTITQDYTNLSRLCRLLNSSLGFLIVVAYLLNMFYLLLQSFVAIAVSYTYEIHFKRILSCFKLTLMLARVSLLCHYGGSVHTENENIIDALVSVPSDIYNSEIDRLLLHASSGTMILTGMNFFKVRRSLLLSMANALVTYELVIIQFVQNFNQLE